MQRHALSILAIALLLGASLVAPVADASQGNGNGGGQDGDGNQGHGNNDDKCDPDNPGKPEDCAGEARIWYKDADIDGFGDDDQTTTANTAPEGYVATGGDCDDGNANVAATCTDNDGDDVYAEDGDCDDEDAQTYPDAAETRSGVDSDCDGTKASTWYEDADEDTFGSTTSTVNEAAPSGYVTDNTDCDDGDASVNPGAPELEDGKDNDCDGIVAEGSDNDSDGFFTHGADSDCEDNDAAIRPDATEIPDDGIDQDCDGADLKTWFRDQDGDGYGAAATKVTANAAPEGYVATGTDCDDGNAAVTTDCDDADSDGTYAVEDCDDTDPLVAASCTDADGDGVYLEAGDCDDANPAWALDCDDTDGDGVLDVDDVCPGFDDNVDLDEDGIPDDCDPEVTVTEGPSPATGTTSTETTSPETTTTTTTTSAKTRYMAVEQSPEPSTSYDLGDGSMDATKADLVKTATATLKNETTFKQGELESFRLQVITRQAEVDHAGGEVDVADLQTRVKAKAKTVVVDVIAEGTLKGQPITSPKDVVDNLDLRFAMPVSHFNENGLDPQKATLHEYSFNHSSQKNEFVRTLQLSQPVLEGDLYVYQIILKDFSSFVFEADALPTVTSGGGGGGGRSGGGPAPVGEPEPEVPVAAPDVEPAPIAEAKIVDPLDRVGAGQQLQPGAATAAAPPAASYWQLWLAALLVIGGLWFLAASARRKDEAYPTAPTMQDRIRVVRRRAQRAIRLALLPMRLRREFGSEDSEARRVAELKAVLHPHRK